MHCKLCSLHMPSCIHCRTTHEGSECHCPHSPHQTCPPIQSLQDCIDCAIDNYHNSLFCKNLSTLTSQRLHAIFSYFTQNFDRAPHSERIARCARLGLDIVSLIPSVQLYEQAHYGASIRGHLGPTIPSTAGNQKRQPPQPPLLDHTHI